MSEFSILDDARLAHYSKTFTGDVVEVWENSADATTKAQWEGVLDAGGNREDALSTMALRPLIQDLYGVDEATAGDSFDVYANDIKGRLKIHPNTPPFDLYLEISTRIKNDPRTIAFNEALKVAYLPSEAPAFFRNRGPSPPQTERQVTLPDIEDVPEPAPEISEIEKDLDAYEQDAPITRPPDWESVISSQWFKSASPDNRFRALVNHRAWRFRYLTQAEGADKEAIDEELHEWYMEQAGHALMPSIPPGRHIGSSVLRGAIVGAGSAIRGPVEAAAASFLRRSEEMEAADAQSALASAGALGAQALLESLQEQAVDLLPQDPILREAFWTGKVPEGVGSALGFAAGIPLAGPAGPAFSFGSGLAARAAGGALSAAAAPISRVAASAMFTQGVETARELDREDIALEIGLLHAPLGLMEGLGFRGFGNMGIKNLVGQVPAGKMAQAVLKRSIAEGTEEAIQESLQTVGEHLIKKYSPLDQNIELDWQEVMENGAVGFIVGSGLSGVGGAGGMARQRLNEHAANRVSAMLTSILEQNVAKLPDPLKSAVQKRMAKEGAISDKTIAEVDGAKPTSTAAETRRLRNELAEDPNAAEIVSTIEGEARAVARERGVEPTEILAEIEGSPLQEGGVRASAEAALGRPLPTVESATPVAAVEGAPAAAGVPPQNLTLDRTTDGTTTAPKVISALEGALHASGSNAPLRVGNLPLTSSAGTFETKARVARIRTANDIATAAHEVAHAAEDALIGSGVVWTKQQTNVEPEIQAELTKLGKALYPSQAPPGGWKSEGFAEFTRLFVMDEAQAKKQAPKFYNWFQENLLKPNPKFEKALRNAQKEAHTWQTQGAEERVRQTIVKTSAPRQFKERTKETFRAENLKRLWLDAGQPIYDTVQTAIDELAVSGETLPAGENPWNTLTEKRLTHDAVTAHMAERAMVDINGHPIGKSLAQALDPVKGKQLEWTRYMYARRALALYAEGSGRNPGISKEDAQFVFELHDSPTFQLAAQNYYQWWDGVLDYMASASPDFAQVVEQMREGDAGDYIPLQREFKIYDQRYSSAYKGSPGAKGDAPFSRLTGSGRRIQDPIETTLKQTSYFLKKAHEKLILDQLINLSERVPGMGEHIVRVRRGLAPAAVRTVDEIISEVDRAVRKVDPEAAAQITTDLRDAVDDIGAGAEVITLFAPKVEPGRGEDPILPVFREGELRWYQVNRDLFRALGGLDAYRFPNWAADVFLGLPARMFRLGTTGLRPSFSLVANPLRDFNTLWVNTRSSASAPRILATWMRSMWQSFWHVATGGRYTTAEMKFFEGMGGQLAQPLGQDIEFTKRAVRRLFASKGKRLFDVRNHVDYLRELLQFPESASRITEVKLLMRDMGIAPGDFMTREQAQALLIAAKQVTTDFTAAGELARKYNAAIPFFNAQIQGPRAHVRAAKHHPTMFAWRAFQMAILAFAAWYRYKDEEWWLEMGSEERYGHSFVPIGDDEMVRIPRPFELGGLMMAGTEAVADAAYREDPEFVGEWAKEFLKGTFVPGLPPLLEEGFEQVANYDTFTEAPIIPQRAEDSFASQQVTPYTSRLAIQTGRIMEKLVGEDSPLASPARIDHAIRGLFGGAGGDFAQLFGNNLPERERELADIPVVGRIFQRGGQAVRRPKSVQQVYELNEHAQKKFDKLGSKETERQREARLLLQDATRAITVAGKIASQFSETSEERRAMLALRSDIARKAVAAYNFDPSNREEFRDWKNDLEGRMEEEN